MKTKIVVVLCIILLAGTTLSAAKSITKEPGVTVRALAKGAPMHGANGLYFGPDGYLYIASCVGNEIIKMDPNSGRILDRIGPERGVLTPDDLTFGPDGSLYWTAILWGMIGKLDPQGNYSAVGNFGMGVNPITFSPDNQWLFSSRDFMGKGFFKVRPDGTGYEELLPDLVNLNGFDFGPDNFLYGPIYAQKVVRINALEAKSNIVVEDVITDIAPSAVKFDTQGRLVTNDNSTGRILRYSLNTKVMEVLATVPFSMDNLAIDSRNQVYVSSDADGYVAKILPNGKYVVLSPGGMILPSGVAVLRRQDGGESVYVGDAWSLREFDGRTGKELSVEPAGVISNGLASSPFSVAADGDNLIVASSLSYAIQEYDPVNHQVLETYTLPPLPFAFVPTNAIRFQSDIVTTEGVAGWVWRQFLPSIWGPIAFYPDLFTQGPVGLATDGSSLWVTDNMNGKVFDISGSAPVEVASELSGPEGIAYYPPDGSLLVVESGAGRLLKINPSTKAKTILAEGLELGFHWFPAFPGNLFTSDGIIDSVAVGPSGAIYVTGNKANVLYRIEIHK
jgi:sugar lactone lactonase YvrE